MFNLVAYKHTKKIKFSSHLNRNNKIILLVSLCFLTSINLIAGGLDNGFEALEIHDYFKAKKLFYKALKKHPSAASYGLSTIYSRNNNPFYSLDSALLYVKVADSTYSHSSEKEKTKILILKVDSNTILDLKNQVDEQCFTVAQEKNNIKSYNHFIINNGITAKQYEKAIAKRDKLAYQIAKKANNSIAVIAFIDTYPNAVQISLAKALLNQLLFNEYTSYNTIENNLKFINDHPNNPYVSIAEKNIYELATANKTIESYTQFIENYPTNPDVPNAWRNIYNLSTQIHTSENIEQFLSKFPNYPFKHELEKDYLLANTPFYPFLKNNKWGFVNEELQIAIPHLYDWVSDFHEGVAAVSKNNKMGYINKNNEIIIPFNYDEAESFNKGLAIVAKNDHYGVINRTGEEIIPIIYSDIGETSFEYLAVELNEKYGFIDKLNNLKVGLEFESVGDFTNGLAYIQLNNLYGIIDTNLFYISKPKFEWLDNFNNAFIRMKENGKYGVINPEGKYIVQPIYDQLSEIENGLALVVKDNLYGYINSLGEVIIPINIELHEGVINWALFNDKKLARIITKDKFGLIDTTGTKFIPALFDDIGTVSDHLIAIKRKGKWGYCDYKTMLKIPYNFQEANSFINNYAIVKSKDFYGIINAKGTYVVDAKYQSIEWINQAFLKVQENDKWGIINLKGKFIIPPNYDKIKFTTDNKMLQLFNGNEFIYSKATLITNND